MAPDVPQRGKERDRGEACTRCDGRMGAQSQEIRVLCVSLQRHKAPGLLKGLTHVPGKEVKGMTLFSYQ